MATLWTIGYEGRAQHHVIELLVDAGISQLVDVRIRPQSRKPGLSKTSLSAALAREDISYEHRRELGTPLAIRGIYRAKQFEEARALYREYLLDEASEHLDWLADVARSVPTAILCFEFDPRHCHRRVISEELTRLHGYEIVDL